MSRRLFLCVALAAATLAGGCFSSGPAATVERFHHDISEGKIEDAMGLIATESLEKIGRDKVRTVLRTGTQQLKEKGGIKKTRIEKEEVTGEVAQVSIYIEYGNGETEFNDVDLVKEKGVWKILFKLGK